MEFDLINRINRGNFGSDIMEEINKVGDSIKESYLYNRAMLALAQNGNYDSSLFIAIGGMNKLAIVRTAEHQKRLERLVMTDELTGLFNRKGFDYTMNNEIARANRSEFRGNAYDFSLMFIDIDNFKDFNDTYGHLAADNVLKKLGSVLNDGRESDIACRYGGDEFGVILSDTNIGGALDTARKLNKRVRNNPIEFEDDVGSKHFRPINLSIGVDGFRKGDSSEHVIMRADDNLYEAKKAGKNCVYGTGKAYCQD